MSQKTKSPFKDQVHQLQLKLLEQVHWVSEREKFMVDNDYYNTDICRYIRRCKQTMMPEPYLQLLYFLGETQGSNGVGVNLYIEYPTNMCSVEHFSGAIHLLTNGEGSVHLVLDPTELNVDLYGDDTGLFSKQTSRSWYTMTVRWEPGTMSELLNVFVFPDYCCVCKSTLTY